MSLYPGRLHHRQFHIFARLCERRIARPLLLVALVLTTLTNLSAQSNYIQRSNHNWYYSGYVIRGDPNRVGRVYIGTNGRGIIYGDGTPESWGKGGSPPPLLYPD